MACTASNNRVVCPRPDKGRALLRKDFSGAFRIVAEDLAYPSRRARLASSANSGCCTPNSRQRSSPWPCRTSWTAISRAAGCSSATCLRGTAGALPRRSAQGCLVGCGATETHEEGVAARTTVHPPPAAARSRRRLCCSRVPLRAGLVDEQLLVGRGASTGEYPGRSVGVIDRLGRAFTGRGTWRL